MRVTFVSFILTISKMGNTTSQSLDANSIQKDYLRYAEALATGDSVDAKYALALYTELYRDYPDILHKFQTLSRRMARRIYSVKPTLVPVMENHVSLV